MLASPILRPATRRLLVRVIPTLLLVAAAAPSAKAAGVFTYTVTGTINWTDAQNVLHPTRDVLVNLLNSDGTATDASGTTDLNGNYTLTFTSFSPFGFKENLQILAKNDGAYVSPDATPDNIYAAYTQPFNTGLGGNTINVNMQNTDTFASPSFSVLDALQTGYQYATAVRGAAPAILPTLFPNTTKDGTSFFSPANNNIQVLLADKWDWDVTLHEYGHYLQNLDKIADNPGGNHAFGVSNIPARGKDAGARLAWGEGSATYIGVAAQSVNVAAFKTPTNMANVGDTRYTDTEDSTLNIDLAVAQPGSQQGEGDELAVSRILWQVATGPRVNRGHINMYADFLAAAAAQPGRKLQNLSQYNNYFLSTVATTDRKRVDFGSVFEDNGVSPQPLSILQDSTVGPTVKTVAINGAFPTLSATGSDPTFNWLAGNNFANNSFTLTIWDSNALTNRIIDTFQILGNVNSYTLTDAQWAIVDATPGMDYFALTGSDTAAPNTGPYWTDAFAFQVLAPEPTSLSIIALGTTLLLHRRRKA